VSGRLSAGRHGGLLREDGDRANGRVEADRRGGELANRRSLRSAPLGAAITTVRLRAASTNDKLQLALGVWWIIDAALQFQPAMFTGRFAREVIAPAAQGQPGFVAAPIRLAGHIILWAPGPFNAVFALIQLAIGLGLLSRRTVRPALVLSVLWSLNVWYLGEGLGGLAGGKAMLLTGAPGAALLYAVLSLAIWPGRDRPAPWLAGAWCFLWGGGVALQLIAGGAAVRDALSTSAQAAPGWMHSLDHALLSALPKSGTAILIALVAVQAWVGLAVLIGPRSRAIPLGGGIVLALAFWLFGESLGMYWTGVATDPNSGPLLVLMALAVLSTAPAPNRRLSGVAQRTGLGGARLRPAAAVLSAGLLLGATVVVFEAPSGRSGHAPARLGTEPAAAIQVALGPRGNHRRLARHRLAAAHRAHAAGRAATARLVASTPLRRPASRRSSPNGRRIRRPARPVGPGGLAEAARAPAKSGPSPHKPSPPQPPAPGPVHQLGQAAQATAGQLPPPAGPAASGTVGQAVNALPPNP